MVLWKKSRHTPKLSCLPSPCSIPQLEMEHACPQPAMSSEWGHPRGHLRGQCETSSDEAARAHHLHSRFALSEQLSHLILVHPKSKGGKNPKGQPTFTTGPCRVLLPCSIPSQDHALRVQWCWDRDTFCPSPCSCPRHWRGFYFSSLTSKTENR